MNDISIELSVSTLVAALSNSSISDFKGIAVAVNNIVIPKATWNTYQLKENDTITVIRATQGG